MWLAYTISIILLAFIAAFFFIWFNRNPIRNPPLQNGIIVSPADGRILYVKDFRAGDCPISRKFTMDVRLEELGQLQAFSEGVCLIGIYLSPFDVHVTRAPISGRVILTEHFIGQLFSRTLLGFKTADERATCVIKGNEGVTVAVIHMAAYFVRRVIMGIRKNSQVTMGERIGKIRLGSQVDIVLPKNLGNTIIVKPGDRVKAGESIIATFNQA